MNAKVGQNLVFLGAMQITNYLVPIIAIPLLLERIGLEKYGIIALSQGLAMIFVSLTDYGFNLTGTREISQSLENKDQLRAIFSKIMQARLLLILLGLPVFLGIIAATPTWRQDYWVIFSSYLMVVAQVLFPVWYFQGVQKMYLITIFNFASRIMYVGGLIFMIREVDDYAYVNLLNGGSWLIWAVVSIYLVIKTIGVPSLTLDAAIIKGILKENFKIFSSNALVSVYRGAPILIAGALLTPQALGIYGVLDKIVSLIHSVAAVIFRSLFPETSRKGKTSSHATVINYVRTFVYKLLIPAIPASILLGWLGPDVLAMVTDKIQPEDVTQHFYWIAVFPVLVLLNLTYSLPIIALDYKSLYFKYHVTGAATMVIAGLLGGYLLGITGLLLSLLATELSMIGYGERSVRGLRRL